MTRRLASGLLVFWAGVVVMPLPFTSAQFFELCAAYNAAMWPAVVLLWLASGAAFVTMIRRGRPVRRWLAALLAAHWIWSAVAFHALFFTRINPAAWLFAALFAIEAAMLIWTGVVRARLSFDVRDDAWTWLAWGLVGYSLIYPALNAVGHRTWLAVPAFGVPCPTTIFTAGVLMLARPTSWRLSAIPIAWSVIGGSAAWLLGVHADYALPVAGLALVLATARFRSALTSSQR